MIVWLDGIRKTDFRFDLDWTGFGTWELDLDLNFPLFMADFGGSMIDNYKQ